MIFTETKLKGSYIIELEKIEDDRGFFSRSFCEREFDEKSINSKYVQGNISFNNRSGTLRGMHYQSKPYEEVKLVSCTKGKIYDVIVDLRPESETFRQWISVELTDENRKIIYIPKSFAHGFITLVDNAEVMYRMSEFFVEGYGNGVRWDDPAFAIQWPLKIEVISDRDRNYPDFVF